MAVLAIPGATVSHRSAAHAQGHWPEPLKPEVTIEEQRRIVVPGVIVHGRYDMIAPVDGAIALARAWPQARLLLVEDGSHSTSEAGVRNALMGAVDEFAGAA